MKPYNNGVQYKLKNALNDWEKSKHVKCGAFLLLCSQFNITVLSYLTKREECEILRLSLLCHMLKYILSSFVYKLLHKHVKHIHKSHRYNHKSVFTQLRVTFRNDKIHSRREY